MILAAYASRYHWSQASQEAKHQARGEWQVSRTVAVLGRGEPAVYHAERCLDWCERGGWRTRTSRSPTRAHARTRPAGNPPQRPRAGWG